MLSNSMLETTAAFMGIQREASQNVMLENQQHSASQNFVLETTNAFMGAETEAELCDQFNKTVEMMDEHMVL